MFLQSLFITVFSLVLTGLFALSTLAAVHSFSITQAHLHMLAAADHAVEAARESAAADLQNMPQDEALPSLNPPSDTMDQTANITISTTVDTTADSEISACTVHDQSHTCNLSIGEGLAERRIWETINLRISPAGNEHLTLRRHVLLRLLRNKPYATVVAIRDDAVSGSQLLGDAAGMPSIPGDAATVAPDDAQTFHDTRVHIYEPCRFVTSSNPAIATDNRSWANWQGGSPPAPARQNTCDTGAGETTQYMSTTQSSAERSSSSWGH